MKIQFNNLAIYGGICGILSGLTTWIGSDNPLATSLLKYMMADSQAIITCGSILMLIFLNRFKQNSLLKIGMFGLFLNLCSIGYIFLKSFLLGTSGGSSQITIYLDIGFYFAVLSILLGLISLKFVFGKKHREKDGDISIDEVQARVLSSENKYEIMSASTLLQRYVNPTLHIDPYDDVVLQADLLLKKAEQVDDRLAPAHRDFQAKRRNNLMTNIYIYRMMESIIKELNKPKKISLN